MTTEAQPLSLTANACLISLSLKTVLPITLISKTFAGVPSLKLILIQRGYLDEQLYQL